MDTDTKKYRAPKGATAPLSPISAACGADLSNGHATHVAVRKPVPPGLYEVALIDASSIAAAACMSVSSWHELVQKGDAPQPAIRRPRFTRWRMSDVREYLAKMASEGVDHDAAKNLKVQATKASRKAAEKRAAARA